MDTPPDTPITRTITDITRYTWIKLFIWTAVIVSLLLLKSMQTTVNPIGIVWMLGIAGILVSGWVFKPRSRAHEQDIVALQQAHDQFQQEWDLFANGSVVVFKWKNQDKWPVEYAFLNVAALLGYTAELFLQGDIVYADIIHPEDISRVADEVTIASQSHEERFEHLPYRLLRPDGERIWVLDYTTILRNDEGDITHYVGYLIDITTQKEIEESLISWLPSCFTPIYYNGGQICQKRCKSN